MSRDFVRTIRHPAAEEKPRSDESLTIERIRAGETDLFVDLVDPYLRTMYATAYSILRNQHDAEDVVQESLLKAFTSLDQLRSSALFGHWLLRITMNEARMVSRRSRILTFVPVRDSVDKDLDHFPTTKLVDSRETPEEALQQKELFAAVDGAWNEIPSQYRDVLQLRCVEELNISEISRVLDLGRPGVKTRIHRARVCLRKLLLPVFPADHTYRAACMRLD